MHFRVSPPSENTARLRAEKRIQPRVAGLNTELNPDEVLFCDPQRDTPRTREICQKHQHFGTFLDTMLADVASETAHGETILKSSEEGGGQYDPSVFALIQRKRKRLKDAGARKDFDTALRRHSEGSSEHRSP